MPSLNQGEKTLAQHLFLFRWWGLGQHGGSQWLLTLNKHRRLRLRWLGHHRSGGSGHVTHSLSVLEVGSHSSCSGGSSCMGSRWGHGMHSRAWSHHRGHLTWNFVRGSASSNWLSSDSWSGDSVGDGFDGNSWGS